MPLSDPVHVCLWNAPWHEGRSRVRPPRGGTAVAAQAGHPRTARGCRGAGFNGGCSGRWATYNPASLPCSHLSLLVLRSQSWHRQATAQPLRPPSLRFRQRRRPACLYSRQTVAAAKPVGDEGGTGGVWNSWWNSQGWGSAPSCCKLRAKERRRHVESMQSCPSAQRGLRRSLQSASAGRRKPCVHSATLRCLPCRPSLQRCACPMAGAGSGAIPHLPLWQPCTTASAPALFLQQCPFLSLYLWLNGAVLI